MSDLWTIVAMGAAVYAIRLTGLALPRAAAPRAWEPALAHVPVALLTALVVASLAGRIASGPAAPIALVAAGFVARRTGRMWACILSGMVCYLLCSWLFRLG
jgi:branched-subunit amino acid transport protein